MSSLRIVLDVANNVCPVLAPGALIIDRLQQVAKMAVILPEQVDGQSDNDGVGIRLLEDQSDEALAVVVGEGPRLDRFRSLRRDGQVGQGCVSSDGAARSLNAQHHASREEAQA